MSQQILRHFIFSKLNVEPWNIGFATYSNKLFQPTITAFNSAVTGIWLDPTGTKLFMSGINGTIKLAQATLTTPWEVDSATITWSSDAYPSNEALYFVEDGSEFILKGSFPSFYRYALNTPWDFTGGITLVDTYSIGGGDNFTLSNDGTKYYYMDRFSSILYQYNLTTAWDFNTATLFNSVALPNISTPDGLFFKPDGTRLYIADRTTFSPVWQYDLNTPWDSSTIQTNDPKFSYMEIAGFSGSLDAVFLGKDGTRLYAGKWTTASGPSQVIQFNIGE